MRNTKTERFRAQTTPKANRLAHKHGKTTSYLFDDFDTDSLESKLIYDKGVFKQIMTQLKWKNSSMAKQHN